MLSISSNLAQLSSRLILLPSVVNDLVDFYVSVLHANDLVQNLELLPPFIPLAVRGVDSVLRKPDAVCQSLFALRGIPNLRYVLRVMN
jgi:hypothetical protein